MAGFLTNKVAIVTGGSRGIGRAIAQSLLSEGASVAICGRTPESVTEAVNAMSAKGGRVIGENLDVANAEAVSRFFKLVDEQLGGLDVLVNNAGIGIFRSVADLSFAEWKATLDTNLSGVFYCCHEAVPRFRHRGGGAIINVSSLAGRNPFAGGSAYNASKFGLNGFSEALMLDHRYDKIRVSYVMPGSVDTDFGGHGASVSWKIAPQDVADAVMLVLRMPERTTISRIEMRPSLPPK
jgi:NAD(P)-dependent dehydrogenase (short-subunit alcohol dehydrogenase family)